MYHFPSLAARAFSADSLYRPLPACASVASRNNKSSKDEPYSDEETARRREAMLKRMLHCQSPFAARSMATVVA
jgi:hypothetical protein